VSVARLCEVCVVHEESICINNKAAETRDRLQSALNLPNYNSLIRFPKHCGPARVFKEDPRNAAAVCGRPIYILNIYKNTLNAEEHVTTQTFWKLFYCDGLLSLNLVRYAIPCVERTLKQNKKWNIKLKQLHYNTVIDINETGEYSGNIAYETDAYIHLKIMTSQINLDKKGRIKHQQSNLLYRPWWCTSV